MPSMIAATLHALHVLPPPPGSPLTEDEVDRTGGQTVQQEPDRIQVMYDERSPYGAMRRAYRRVRGAVRRIRRRGGKAEGLA